MKKISLKKLLHFSLFLFFCYLCLEVYLVNKNINAYLNLSYTPKTLQILSETKKISQGEKYSKEELKKNLLKRNYKESNKNIEKSFQVHKNTIIINTANYLNEFAKPINSRKVAYDLNKKRIISLDEKENQFSLEPYSIFKKKGLDLKLQKKVNFGEIPKALLELLVLNEDKRFYQHKGIDLYGILRASLINIRHLSFKEGGSTITQQLVKNVFLKRSKKISRKLKEALYAIILEQKLTKNKILTLYLNEIYFGQLGHKAIYGISKGASIFFNKKVKDLNILESASLVALLRAPSSLAPYKNLKLLEKKAFEILEKALRENVINLKTFNLAKKFKLKTYKVKTKTLFAPYFINALLKEIKSIIINNKSNNLKIYTSLNTKMQSCGEKSIRDNLKDFKNLEASLLSLEVDTGLVKAWIGGRDYKKSNFDRVNMSNRQIGSLVKPFIYLKAFKKQVQLTPQSTILDLPISVKLKDNKIWKPKNYDNKFLGAISLREALIKSRNIPAVLKAKEIKFKNLNTLLNKLNITKEKDYRPSISLGAVESSLLNITSAYNMLANNGNFIKPRLYKSIVRNSNLLKLNKPEKIQIIEKEYAQTINFILEDVLVNGTAKVLKKLNFNQKASGKTGTTNLGRDNWFIAYTPKLITGIWVGNDDFKPTKLSASKIAVPIFANYMKCIGEKNYKANNTLSKNTIIKKIDKNSQQLATKTCPKVNVINEIYIKGREPKSFCQLHGGVGETKEKVQKKEKLRKRRDRSFFEVIREN